MNNKYRHNNTNVSMINFHIVICPRYRRKIFLIDGLEARFKEVVVQICGKYQMELIAMECDVDHAHIFVNVPPTMSAADVVRVIKGGTAIVLLKEFEPLSRMANLWTRSYFASTAGTVSADVIKKYVESQKKRSG